MEADEVPEEAEDQPGDDEKVLSHPPSLPPCCFLVDELATRSSP